jgi:hypothetical protein
MAFSLFGKPFGYAAGGQVQAPRTTNVRGQHHKLAYINNEEEALLRARGGTGEKVHGGIPAFRPVRGKTQGRSNAGTGFSGGSGGGGGGGGGGGSDSGQANNPPPSGGNNNNSGGGNPGDQASGGYGSGNSGGNAGSSPPSSTIASGPSQAEINERNRINRERAQAEADRREAQDQAIRDQIESDRAAQVEADRRERNRAIVMGSQLPANNVYAGTTPPTTERRNVQQLTQKAKSLGFTVERVVGKGMVVKDITGQELGPLSDIDNIAFRMGSQAGPGPSTPADPTVVKPEIVPATTVPTTLQQQE